MGRFVSMGKGAIAHGEGSGDGKGACSCCSCWETDCKAPDPENTPRWVTDIIFLIAFIAFWIGMFVCAGMGFSSGDVSRLMYFIDYNGNRCGENGFGKYVHWTHPLNAGTNVCVDSCPGQYVGFTLVATTTATSGYTTTQYSSWTACETGSAGITTGGCGDSSTTANSLIGSSSASCCTYDGGAPNPDGMYICVPAALSGGGTSEAQEYVDSFGSLLAAATSDLIIGWWIIMLSAIIALIMSFIWSYILKYSAACFVYSVVALSNLTLIVATGMSYYMYDKYKKAYDDDGLSNDQQMMYLMMVCLVVFGCAAFILFCMLIFVIYWILVAAFMASAGEYTQGDTTGVYTLEYTDSMQKAIVYHFFGLLWTMAFMRHMTILILAGAFGTWYWTSLPDKKAGKFHELHPTPIMSSVKRSFCYHVGTVAFGSFIIAVIQMIQYVLEYIKKKQESEYLKWIITCIQACVKCFERVMEYISKMAYIVTACKGNMFCTAAWESFCFILKHLGQHAIVNYISAFLMILGKMFIICTTVALCFLLAGTNSDLSSPYVLLIVCALISYLVASLFLGVFDTGIDVILVCFCWELDANGAMENSEGEKQIYGTEGLIKFIEGAKKQAEELAKGGSTPESSAPGGTTEVQPAAQADPA